MVCRSVTLVSPAKMAEPIEMLFGLRTLVGPGNHVLDGVQIPQRKRAILRGKGASRCKVWGHSAVIYARTAEPTRCRLGCGLDRRRNHGLDGDPAVLRDVDTATNFGTQFVITGFVGNNFGCMIANNTLFDSRGGFSGSSYLMKT